MTYGASANNTTINTIGILRLKIRNISTFCYASETNGADYFSCADLSLTERYSFRHHGALNVLFGDMHVGKKSYHMVIPYPSADKQFWYAYGF